MLRQFDMVFGSVFQGDEKEPQYFVNYCQLARESNLKEVEVDKEVEEEEAVVDEAVVEVETVGTQIITDKEIDPTNKQNFKGWRMISLHLLNNNSHALIEEM